MKRKLSDTNQSSNETYAGPLSSVDGVTETYDARAATDSRPISDFRRCSNCITVEPLVICSAFINSLYVILSKEYIRQRLALEHHLVVNDTASCNETGVNTSDPNYILQQKVSAEATSWVLYLSISNFLPGLFSSIVLGSWGDKVGRKFPMLVSLIGVAVMMAVYLIVILFSLPLQYLFIGQVVSGVFGDFGNILSSSFAYSSDISDSNKRTIRMAILETCIGLGAFLSSITSGAWDLRKGFQNPFWCLCGIAVCEILYTVIFLPSNSDAKLTSSLRYLFSKVPFKHMYQVIKPRHDGRHVVLILFNISFCIFAATTMGAVGLLVIYEIGVPFCWSSLLVGIGSAIYQLAYFVTLSVLKLLPALSAEPKLVMVSAVVTAISFILFALAQQTWMIFLGLVFQLLIIIPAPVLRSQSSRLVSPDEVGSVFAIISCVLNIGKILGSLAFEGLFVLTASSALPGAAFFMGVGFLMVATPLYLIGYHKSTLKISNAPQYDPMASDPND